MRTLGVIGFILVVAAVALFAAMRPTIARGDVLAADLMKTNGKVLSSLTCDPDVPIGVDGATFWCDATFRAGPPRRLHFQMARTGAIKQIGREAAKPGPSDPAPINKADPWE